MLFYFVKISTLVLQLLRKTMKKIFLLSLFTFCLLSTTNVIAQNTLEINNVASEITAELKKEIKFNTEQEHQVYDAYVLYKKRISAIEINNNASSISQEKKKAYSQLHVAIKTILTDEQYELFKDIEKRNLN